MRHVKLVKFFLSSIKFLKLIQHFNIYLGCLKLIKLLLLEHNCAMTSSCLLTHLLSLNTSLNKYKSS